MYYVRLVLNTFVVILVTTVIFTAYSCIRGGIHDEQFLISDVVEPPAIRVALTHGASHDLAVPEVSVAVDGPVRILSLDGMAVIRKGDSLQTKLSNGSGVVKIQQFVTGERAVRIVPGRSGTLQVGRRYYHGELIVWAEGADRVVTVNHVDMENYIAGVIGSEIGLSSATQTLKAQAIAARTYAMYELKEKEAAPQSSIYDVLDDQRSQVYSGTEKTDAGILKLVRQTRGTFLTYRDRIFKSYYSSTCGGHTEPARDILGEGVTIPPLSGRRCDYCREARYATWKAAWTRHEVVARLKEHWKDMEFLDISAVSVTRRAPGGHALKVAFTVEPGSRVREMHAYAELRRMLNNPTPPDGKNIRSSWFDVVLEGGIVRFNGRGFGHGVGMCQIGAQNLGKLGYSASDILRYYYPGAEIVQLY